MATRVSLCSDGYELCGWFRQGLAPRNDIPVLLIQGFPGGGDDMLGLGHRLAGYGTTPLRACSAVCSGRWSNQAQWYSRAALRPVSTG
ncbi:MAG: hypothetical protein Q8P31_12825 [Bacillota bacterium]|nr:hypothetical protein [Bacillota bacterium]